MVMILLFNMLKSIELEWLTRKIDKTLSIPTLIYSDNENSYCGGSYYDSADKEICIDGKYYSLKNGLIVIYGNNISDDKHFIHTLAHEFRHSMYDNKKILYDGIEMDMLDEYNYDWVAKQYFTKSKSEYDALMFAHKYAPSSCSTHWIDLIYDNNVKPIKIKK